MKLHNTLTRQVQEFKPIKEAEVTLYTCGPTVYDFAQLGNLRSFVFEDTLRRTLSVHGYKVKHVMNITDVGHLVNDDDEGEDKLEEGAKRESKSVWDVARYYEEAFKADARKLNILQPNGYQDGKDRYARATDFISQQLDIVHLLVEKGFAYITDQAIYFDTAKLDSYGELTGQKLADKETAARHQVVTDENKKHPQDFALWFFTVGRFEHHEMRWQSPWGEGFPGWHLECSAIIHTTLGDPIDIHTGGVDHIGTHHTNEMAQTEAAYGHRLANYWVHNEFLLVENQRMAKSLGNFFTLSDIEKKGYEPLSLRLLFLQSHYRSQVNFTWEAIESAQRYLKHLQAFADLRYQPLSGASAHDKGFFESANRQILEDLGNDLATPSALAKLNDVVGTVSSQGLNPADLEQFGSFLEFIDEAFGLDLLKSKDIEAGQKAIIRDRESARKASDWSKSDRLRRELINQSIELNDTPQGQIWRRA